MNEPSADIVRERLESLGEVLTVGGDSPFELVGHGGWYVAEGYVDIFSVRMRDGQLRGHRRHLFRVGEGEMILGVGSAGHTMGLLGVGGTGTRVVRLGGPDLDRLAQGETELELVDHWIAGWVGHLYETLSPGLPPEDCEELEPGQLEHDSGEALQAQSRSGLLWVRSRAGSYRLLGRDDLSANGQVSLPMAGRAWIEIPEESGVEVATTGAVARSEGFWPGLDGLHGLLLEEVHRGAREEIAAERRRLDRRAEADLRSLQEACAQVADTLEAPGEPAELDASIHPDPLVRAAQMVGDGLGIDIDPPPSSQEKLAQGDPVGTIARASRIRVRKVLLREGWFREDSGPLLAFRHEGQEPVALLPVRGKGYSLHDPVTGEVESVSEELADSLDPNAYSFYRPFPNRAIGLRDLAVFGALGGKRDLIVVLLMGAVGGLLSLVPPMATSQIFNSVVPGAERQELLQLTLILIAMSIASALFQMTGTLAMVRLEGRSAANMQAAIWDRVLSLPVPFFRPFTSGDLASRAMSIESMRQIVSGQVVSVLLSGIFSLFHFGLLFYYSPRLALWATGLVGIAFVMTVTVGRLQVRSERHVAGVRNRLSGTVLQFLSSISKLRIAGAETRAFSVWAREFSKQRRYQFRARTVGNVLKSFNGGFPVIANLVIFAAAAYMLTAADSLRTGDFMAFMSSFGTCLSSVMAAGGAIVAMASALPLYEQAKPILEALPEVDEAKTDPGVLEGNLSVHHVSFRYDAEGPLVLRDISFEVEAGEFVAFVGSSGSGKSTMLRLLLGFESPEAGGLYYDGQELDSLDLRSLRTQIGVVLQNGRFMSGDLFTNIVGSSTASLDDAWEAARQAGLDADIRDMPMGMHTVI
ncbi:MAG: NHLP bacteriocin export ABC transporter permease/ATPase subunit, partial [Holophagales bacterium]|nr:NHLP bacteriocin export ABC transporter permease/ATPase subunit [Holophagales bacterium]